MTDESLHQLIIRERRLSHRHASLEDLEDGERRAEEAQRELKRRHPLGTAGREGLPDQG